MAWGSRSGATVLVVCALLGGYLTADSMDVVPGMLTTAAPWPEPAPFPTAPGAVEGPELAQSVQTLPADAPMPDAADIQTLVDGVARDTRLGSRVGVVVLDSLTGEVLGSAAPDQLMIPASTQKVLTAAAALTLPELAERTLDTRAVLADNTLFLVGGGDMMLSSGVGDPAAVNGRAGLANLADQVVAHLSLAGRTEVRLAVDDTLFSGPPVAATVNPANVAAGYISNVSALGVNVGLLKDTYDDSGPRASDPAMAAAQAFAERLAERGVTVSGSVLKDKAPSSARELGSVSSAPVNDVVEFFLHTSDNTITEVVGRLVAVERDLPGTAEGATQAVTSVVQNDLDVDLAGARLADLSGLGDNSRLTPAQLAEVIRLTMDPERPMLREVAVGMPVAGLNGTLTRRFGQNVAEAGLGMVRAKTGSLPGVTALSGTVVTSDARQLVFVLMADSYTGVSLDAQAAVDQFVAKLAAYSAG